MNAHLPPQQHFLALKEQMKMQYLSQLLTTPHFLGHQPPPLQTAYPQPLFPGLLMQKLANPTLSYRPRPLTLPLLNTQSFATSQFLAPNFNVKPQVLDLTTYQNITQPSEEGKILPLQEDATLAKTEEENEGSERMIEVRKIDSRAKM